MQQERELYCPFLDVFGDALSPLGCAVSQSRSCSPGGSGGGKASAGPRSGFAPSPSFVSTLVFAFQVTTGRRVLVILPPWAMFPSWPHSPWSVLFQLSRHGEAAVSLQGFSSFYSTPTRLAVTAQVEVPRHPSSCHPAFRTGGQRTFSCPKIWPPMWKKVESSTTPWTQTGPSVEEAPRLGWDPEDLPLTTC